MYSLSPNCTLYSIKNLQVLFLRIFYHKKLKGTASTSVVKVLSLWKQEYKKVKNKMRACHGLIQTWRKSSSVPWARFRERRGWGGESGAKAPREGRSRLFACLRGRNSRKMGRVGCEYGSSEAESTGVQRSGSPGDGTNPQGRPLQPTARFWEPLQREDVC